MIASSRATEQSEKRELGSAEGREGPTVRRETHKLAGGCFKNFTSSALREKKERRKFREGKGEEEDDEGEEERKERGLLKMPGPARPGNDKERYFAWKSRRRRRWRIKGMGCKIVRCPSE